MFHVHAEGSTSSEVMKGALDLCGSSAKGERICMNNEERGGVGLIL